VSEWMRRETDVTKVSLGLFFCFFDDFYIFINLILNITEQIAYVMVGEGHGRAKIECNFNYWQNN
jgi:hypothetical protein